MPLAQASDISVAWDNESDWASAAESELDLVLTERAEAAREAARPAFRIMVEDMGDDFLVWLFSVFLILVAQPLFIKH